jgi:hypothetical protein
MIRHYFSVRPAALRSLAPSILAVLLAGTALAQDASDAAPPSLVGRVSRVEGQVSLLRAGQTEWVQAAINEPISIGDALYANDGGDSRIEIGAADIDLKADSEIDIAQLDQNNGALRLDAGTVDLRVSELPTVDGISIATPRGTVRLTKPGIYRIDAGAEDQPTAVTAWNGAAQLGDTAAAVNVQPGQTLLISGCAAIFLSDRFGRTALGIPAAAADHRRAALHSAGHDRGRRSLSVRRLSNRGRVWRGLVSERCARRLAALPLRTLGRHRAVGTDLGR